MPYAPLRPIHSRRFRVRRDLLEQRSFESGVTMHHYAIRNESEAGS
jgi:hypothetical protein